MSVYDQAAQLYAQRIPFALMRHSIGKMTLLKKLKRRKDGTLVFGHYKVSPWPYDKPVSDYPDAPFTSTARQDYLKDIEALLHTFSSPFDKTVIVRKIAGKLPHDFTNPDVFSQKLKDYFKEFIIEFCYVYYTPETGLWMGASPELLLKKFMEDNILTQALAGTRPVTERGTTWSEKDGREHMIVVNDMVQKLRHQWHVNLRRPSHTLYGQVQHLQTTIEIEAGRRDYPKILSTIYPTPAICGNPTDKAIENIRKFERFPRQYYTGILSFSDSTYKSDYAVLRCAHIDDGKYEIFTGSGIVPGSIPEEEWNETEAKAAPLIQFFS